MNITNKLIDLRSSKMKQSFASGGKIVYSPFHGQGDLGSI